MTLLNLAPSQRPVPVWHLFMDGKSLASPRPPPGTSPRRCWRKETISRADEIILKQKVEYQLASKQETAAMQLIFELLWNRSLCKCPVAIDEREAALWSKPHWRLSLRFWCEQRAPITTEDAGEHRPSGIFGTDAVMDAMLAGFRLDALACAARAGW